MNLDSFFGAPDIDGLITQALLIGDYEAAVSLCLHDNRMADSIILAIAGGPELLEKTQKQYFTKTQSKISKVGLYKTHWCSSAVFLPFIFQKIEWFLFESDVYVNIQGLVKIWRQRKQEI